MTQPQSNKSPGGATLTIKSRTERLSEVREFVSAAAREFGFDEEAVNKIALAVDEACTNVIKHSYKYATDKDIRIRIVTNAVTFEVRIQDQGLSFDPETIKKPDMKEYLAHYRRGGLGMYLMRSLMDDVEYIGSPEMNEVRLMKRLQPK